METIKKHWKDILLVAVYIIVAAMIYFVWFETMWHKLWVDILTISVIVLLGCLIGFFYIHGMDKKKEEPAEAKPEEPKTEVSENQG